MPKFLPFLVAALLCIAEAAGPALGKIEGRLEFPDKSAFNITTRIVLNQGEYTTYSRSDGTFTIFNVDPGVHSLEVYNPVFHFAQVRAQFLEDDMENPKFLEYTYPGATKRAIAHPLALRALARYDYFEERKGFSFLSILKNPMVIMMAFSVGLMFLMPKMMEGMEPEEKEKMRQQMEMQKDPTKMLSQLWGDVTGAPEEPQRKIKK